MREVDLMPKTATYPKAMNWGRKISIFRGEQQRGGMSGYRVPDPPLTSVRRSGGLGGGAGSAEVNGSANGIRRAEVLSAGDADGRNLSLPRVKRLARASVPSGSGGELAAEIPVGEVTARRGKGWGCA